MCRLRAGRWTPVGILPHRMPNVRLSTSRQRCGSAVIYAGVVVAVVGWIPMSLWFAPAHFAPVVTCASRMLLVFAGMVGVTNKVACPKCGKAHWIMGQPTRLNCAYCGAAYFDEPESLDPAG